MMFFKMNLSNKMFAEYNTTFFYIVEMQVGYAITNADIHLRVIDQVFVSA